MQAITSFYTTCFLHASLSPGYMCIYISYVWYTSISAFLMWYMTFPLFPSTLLQLPQLLPRCRRCCRCCWCTPIIDDEQIRWLLSVLGLGIPFVDIHVYVCVCVGCLVMQFHSGMRDSQSIQFTHTPSRTFISMQEMKATASVCLLVEATNKSYIFLPLRWVGFYYIFGRLTHTHI